jgi:hypothetical protein
MWDRPYGAHRTGFLNRKDAKGAKRRKTAPIEGRKRKKLR